MAVYNGEARLRKSMESILSQQDINYELIVVNDGSTDSCAEILDEYAQKDSRIVLIHKRNEGLTRALIDGCAVAKGRFIARQDAGDISLPDRLSTQLKSICEKSNVVMLSTGTSFVAPFGEEVYSVIQTSSEAMLGLQKTTADKITGPSHHGSVMFKADVYRMVGGYRKEFVVAQDLDLWTRLIEHGIHQSLENIFYQATLDKNSISMLRRDLQLSTTKKILACAQARARCGTDINVLKGISDEISSSQPPTASNSKSDAAYYYFLGSNLVYKNPTASAKYLILSLRSVPLQWKAILKLLYVQWRRIIGN
jgi:glycosyltransferase involved in cell wall biosynthesis